MLRGRSPYLNIISLRPPGGQAEENKMPQKKWKFNVIDVIAVALILAVVAFLGVKVLGGNHNNVEMVDIRYSVLCEDQHISVYENVQKYVPAALMASGTLYDAKVVSVEASPVLVCSNGEWKEDPNHVDLIFVVEGTAEKAPVLTPKVGAQEIRIGNEIILKTEYMEFDPSYVIDVEYP